jgi:hypothetical protein
MIDALRSISGRTEYQGLRIRSSTSDGVLSEFPSESREKNFVLRKNEA